MKLADIHGSEPCARKGVGVQISPWAQKIISKLQNKIFHFALCIFNLP